MRRRARTLVFLIGAVALLGVAVLAELRHERALALDPLTTLDLAAVKRIEVDCMGCVARHYEKVDAHWRQRDPDAPADEAMVERLLAIAHAPVRVRHAAGDLEAAKVGLAPPFATLRLDDTELRFGGTDAIRGDRFVAVGDAIALVPDRFSAWLFKAAALPGKE
ncbi:MAG: hypothetical protein ACTHK2_01940 [Dokdonella sp.]|uniref:hypothetical protein n=1 Tax=Dokdonella sp. TaxID=2291710 RepID=UPI003F7E21E3